MTARTQKNLTVALVVELVAIAVLAGLGPAFPTGVDAHAGWSFVSSHAFALAHALLGVLVLAQASALTVAARSKVVPALVLAGVAVAVAAGAAYVLARQPGPALGVMTAGWLVSLAAAIVELVRLRRHREAAS